MTINLDLELADGALTFTNTRATRGRATKTPVHVTAEGDDAYAEIDLSRRDLVELRAWLDHLLLGNTTNP